MDPFVKLYKKFLSWEWYDDPITKAVFLHLLLKARYKNERYRGQELKAGQVLTGRLQLAKEVNLGEQQIRTALNKLKSTNEITIESTSQYSIITINNWDFYQQTNQQTNQQLTNNQPTTNQQLTTSKEIKEIKEIKEKGSADAVSPQRSKLLFTDNHLKLAKELWDFIGNNYPYYKQPDFSKWAHELRLIEEVDGFSISQIEDVAAWALTESDFWAKQIRSPKNLRRHFRTLIDQSGIYQKWSKVNGVY